MTAAFAVRPAIDVDLDSLPDAWARGSLRRNSAGWCGVVAEHRGRIVGFWGARKLPMLVRDVPLIFGVLEGCFLDEAYRAGGVHSVFIELDETFAELFEGRDEGRLACVVGRFAESDWWTLRRLRDFAPIRTEVDLVLESAAAVWNWPTTERAEVLDDAACKRWTTPLCIGVATVRRDGALMQARRGPPDEGGQILAVVRDGVVAGCLIRRDVEGRRDITDWCVAEGDDSAAAALSAAALDGALGPVVFPVFSRSPWLLAIQRAGFRVRPAAWGGAAEPYLGARSAHPRCDADWLADHWFAVAADVCRYPLPVCHVPEDITTPPPSGTRSGGERHA